MNRLGQQLGDCVPEATRQSQVNEEMERLTNSITSCGDALDRLASRLTPILLNSPTPKCEKNNPAPLPVLAPLAESLRTRVDSVLSIRQRIETLLNQCEL